MLKVTELKASLEKLKGEAQAFLDEGKTSEAQAKMDEIKDIKAKIAVQEALDADEAAERERLAKEKAAMKELANSAKDSAMTIRAMIKKFSGAHLSEAENALLLPTTSSANGANGESYILPMDVRTRITELTRQYKSFREVLGYMPVSALTGSFPVESISGLTGLVDFADGTDGSDASDISFSNVSFSLKEKGAFIKLSNTLLSLTDNDLVSYVARVFAKKAVITENSLAITALATGKTKKQLTDIAGLKTSINVDLDPAVLFGACIVTNQTGFNFLDKQTVSTTDLRPLLQPDMTQASGKTLFGLPVHVFSDTLLPSTAATSTKAEKSPFIYGNLAEAAKFVDLGGQIGFATSDAAGFWSNTTVARLIEWLDVVQADSSDKCYVYAEMATAPATSGN